MGYVAVQGGVTAIENSEQLADYIRLKGKSAPIRIRQIQDQLRLLVDRVMGEGGLYSPLHAALAIKQSEGDPLEASFYIRAYRSTLCRVCDTYPLEMEEMRVVRRISSAFKDIPGGQILGYTSDYRQRMLDFSLMDEDESKMEEILEKYDADGSAEAGEDLSGVNFKKVVEILREQDLVRLVEGKETEPAADITKESINFPAHRSARLQTMARSETGGILAMAYSSMRGYGSIHPTIAELRVGFVPATIPHPYRKNENYHIGSIQVTETEIVAKFGADHADEKPYFTLGYGICFGSNEVKSISMAVLDRTMKATEAKSPAEDQEFVLMHIDGIESSGFCAHFKLPHYITFQSDLSNLRKTQEHKEQTKTGKER
ncbi:MAG: carbon-phosphorus lyase complex subunit PhnI [Clostridia bacterium]|nr:carbon-phosphorus lyase complex subunit PhnI [Clostridia bacterium]